MSSPARTYFHLSGASTQPKKQRAAVPGIVQCAGIWIRVIRKSVPGDHARGWRVRQERTFLWRVGSKTDTEYPCPRTRPAAARRFFGVLPNSAYKISPESLLRFRRCNSRRLTGLNAVKQPRHILPDRAHDLQPFQILLHFLRRVAVNHVPVLG